MRAPLTLLLITCLTLGTQAASQPPNIVIILADDLGIGDVSCYNAQSKIQTPFMDQLATEGMRFTDAHTPSAVCTPTRYGLLTGRYAWRTRLKNGVLDGFSPPLIEPSRPTLASLLRQSGYRSACIGKWHLGLQWTNKDGSPETEDRGDMGVRPGFDIDYQIPFTGGPLALGFDHFFGISASLNLPPFCFLEQDKPHLLPTIHQQRMRDASFQATDEGLRSPDFTNLSVMPRFAGEAVRFIQQCTAAEEKKPFFLYAPLSSPHLPVVTNQEYLGKSDAGEYGDFVVETDAFLGAILEALDRCGVAENTLILFTSDNGGLFHYWEAREADDLKHYKLPPRAQLIREFGHQGNAQLRGTKADIWEGGHRVPFLIRWPAIVKPGSISDTLVELNDLMATLADITGQPTPTQAQDSHSFAWALRGQPETPENQRPYAVHHSLTGVFAIREGPWKLVPNHRGSGGFSQPKALDPAKEGGPSGQLYNLQQDPQETRNLFDQHPEIVARLSQRLQTIQADTR
jgi:arylsulfatase A